MLLFLSLHISNISHIYVSFFVASRNRPAQPPPYTPPAGPFYSAPPPAYYPPQTPYYNWVPTNTFPTAPPRKYCISYITIGLHLASRSLFEVEVNKL